MKSRRSSSSRKSSSSRSSSSTVSSPVKNVLDPKDGLFLALEEMAPKERLALLRRALASGASRKAQSRQSDSGPQASPSASPESSPAKLEALKDTLAK